MLAALVMDYLHQSWAILMHQLWTTDAGDSTFHNFAIPRCRHMLLSKTNINNYFSSIF